MPVCAAPLCGSTVHVEARCPMHGGKDAALARPVSFSGLPNPWAAVSPDCPLGHHARDVYRWSYDPGDPLPWFCARCLRRFATAAVA